MFKSLAVYTSCSVIPPSPGQEVSGNLPYCRHRKKIINRPHSTEHMFFTISLLSIPNLSDIHHWASKKTWTKSILDFPNCIQKVEKKV